ncbi:hypothetical protein BYT27DRAFT_7337634 [Phlegmacium glaucopus]|nr:hypothetical protein BYT27DRAFT_7337634 [Phlegmacium glaucopus]
MLKLIPQANVLLLPLKTSTLKSNLGILHRDISPNNLLLHQLKADENASGLLIDFDYSEELELVEHRENSMECEVNTDKAVDADEVTGPSEIFEAENIHTGTLPFMAIKALLAEGNDEYAHLPLHDLESILYVILYICTFTKGPGLPQLDFETPDTVSMKAWFITESIKAIGSRKLADMCQPKHTLILGFKEYFASSMLPPPLQPSWSQPSDT